MTDLSIIIISYNTESVTKKCLDTVFLSLQNVSFNTEIIVFDNNSSDGSVEMLKSVECKVKNVEFKFIESKENLGFAKGNNKVAKIAQGKVLLFLNSDIEVIDNAIPELYTYFTGSENTFNFVGGKLMEADGITPQASCGPFYTLPVAFAALFLKADYYHMTRYSPDSIKEVDWVSGACIMCTKKDYESVDGFDEKIFMYMDEIDLLYRAKKKGMSVGFYPDARFIHLGSASSKGRTQPIIQVYKGFIYFYKKHYSPLQLSILRFMLKLKAVVALSIGKVTRSAYLIETYEKALEIAQSS